MAKAAKAGLALPNDHMMVTFMPVHSPDGAHAGTGPAAGLGGGGGGGDGMNIKQVLKNWVTPLVGDIMKVAGVEVAIDWVSRQEVLGFCQVSQVVPAAVSGFRKFLIAIGCMCLEYVMSFASGESLTFSMQYCKCC